MESIVDYILEPILSLRVADYDVPTWSVGLFYSCLAFMFVVGTFLFTCCLPRWLPYRVTIITSLFMLAASFALIGPPFADKNVAVMTTGLCLAGFFMSSTVIPLMPEMLQASRKAFPDCDRDLSSSLLSGIYNAAFGVGQAVGPVLGSLLYQLIGFRYTVLAAAAGICGVSVLYLLCA